MNMSRFFMLLVVSAAVILAGCKERGLDVKRPELGEPYISRLPDGTPLLEQEVTVFMRPPFYKGGMPFRYISIKRMQSQGRSMTLVYDFGEWRNLYIYNESKNVTIIGPSKIPDGAKSINKRNELVAEARLLGFTSSDNNNPKLELEEFHYGPGGIVTFYCKSQYDFIMGIKESETDAKGRKEKDYYFLWPTSKY